MLREYGRIECEGLRAMRRVEGQQDDVIAAHDLVMFGSEDRGGLDASRVPHRPARGLDRLGGDRATGTRLGHAFAAAIRRLAFAMVSDAWPTCCFAASFAAPDTTPRICTSSAATRTAFSASL